MKKNILIYGYTALGEKIAKVLKNKNYEIIVIDFDEKLLEKASQEGFETVNSTLLNDNELIQLGIKENTLDSLFCVSNNNKNNLFITLSARSLNKELKIISVSKTKAESKKLLIAGASKVLNPNESSAFRISRHMIKPRVLNVLDKILFNQSSLSISEIYISKKSLLNNTFLKDMCIHKQFNILLLGIMDNELGDNFIFNTKGINHKIDEGDVLVVLGKSLDLKNFKKYLEGAE